MYLFTFNIYNILPIPSQKYIISKIIQNWPNSNENPSITNFNQLLNLIEKNSKNSIKRNFNGINLNFSKPNELLDNIQSKSNIFNQIDLYLNTVEIPLFYKYDIKKELMPILSQFEHFQIHLNYFFSEF